MAADRDRDHVAIGKTSRLVYTPATVPDYGRWPDFDRRQSHRQDHEGSEWVRRCQTYVAAWREGHAAEIARRRQLYGRVHMLDLDNGRQRIEAMTGPGDLLTVCLLQYAGCDFTAETIAARAALVTTIEANGDESIDMEERADERVFVSDKLVDVTCTDCLAIVAHLTALERARRGVGRAT